MLIRRDIIDKLTRHDFSDGRYVEFVANPSTGLVQHYEKSSSGEILRYGQKRASDPLDYRKQVIENLKNPPLNPLQFTDEGEDHIFDEY